ncbi:MAG: ABC transporter permease [Pseudomonadota bacterium]
MRTGLFAGLFLAGSLGLGLFVLMLAHSAGGFGGFWPLAVLAILAAAVLFWFSMADLSERDGGVILVVVPLMFGVLLLFLWEVLVLGFQVPKILLPAPSAIWQALVANNYDLWLDFQQTFVRSVITGWVLGGLAGFLVAVAIDRSPYLQRGLLPIGSMISAMPIVGIAPIMVMWFGFDWQSKVAVIVVMTFFPMLVNTLAGLAATGTIERDLMRSYASSYWQTLFKLRLPAALPFIFNALKLNSTLALIGAIVAEFFGTPVVGMGFRISTEVARFNVDIVWATIAIAAAAGSASYGLIALIERAATFWHPSYRAG